MSSCVLWRTASSRARIASWVPTSLHHPTRLLRRPRGIRFGFCVVAEPSTTGDLTHSVLDLRRSLKPAQAPTLASTHGLASPWWRRRAGPRPG